MSKTELIDMGNEELKDEISALIGKGIEAKSKRGSKILEQFDDAIRIMRSRIWNRLYQEKLLDFQKQKER